MKRYTRLLQLLVVLILGSAVAFAQGTQTTRMYTVDTDPNAQTIVSGTENTTVTFIDESFENNVFPPSGWSKQNPDGGSGWQLQISGTSPVPGWPGGTIMTPPGGGQNVAFCTYTTGGLGTSDQWLITPKITGVTSSDSLSFAISNAVPTGADTLYVLVSTTGNSISDFTNMIAVIPFGPNDTAWMYKEYSLSVYAGEEIYIAFREHVDDNMNDGGAFLLDMVKVGVNSGSVSQMWDIQLRLDADVITSGLGLTGSEFDGSNFIVTEWGFQSNKDVFVISPSGNLLSSFTPTWVSGSSGLRDLAWDGTYLYGSNATTTIYQFTPSGNFISAITSPVDVRAIAYDPVNDAFWVNNWSSTLTLISRTGTILNTIASPPSIYGMAYDNNTAGGPYLWVFSGTTDNSPLWSPCQVEQYSVATGQPTGVVHDVATDISAYYPGDTLGGIAGGLFTAPNIIPGEFTLGGLMQTKEDIFCYYLDMVVGTDEQKELELEVSVYPNPTSGTLNIRSDEMILRLEMMNALGQLVYAAQVDDLSTSIDVKGLESGTYFLHLEGEGKEVTRKVTIP